MRRGIVRTIVRLARLLRLPSLALLALAVPALAAGPPAPVAAQPQPIYLPYVAGRPAWPDPELADAVWAAVERFVEVYPETSIFPAAGREPSLGAAAANVEAACADFPDMDGVPFGPGAHHRACYAWVAEFMGLFHGAAARRAAATGSDAAGSDSSTHAAWAARYLDVALHHLSRLTYGPEDAPEGEGHRDTLAAIWQNPQRAVDIAIVADLVRAHGALTPEARAEVEEVLSAVARAWMVELGPEGRLPSHGVRLTTRTAPEHVAHSIAGRQVVSGLGWTFEWDADKGSSPAEELAWMGAGAMLSARVLAGALGAEEVGRLRAAGERYASFAVAFDRLDPVTGERIRTLNAETEGGPHGQNRLWIENHTDDVPAIPYLGWTWYYLGAALFASPADDRLHAPWPGLAPDADQWAVLAASAEATLHDPAGRFLVDLTPGGGLGFDVSHLPGWTTDCGAYRRGTHYPRYDGRAGGPALWVSEIGHPAGLDLLAAGWPLLRLATDRGDTMVAERWRGRLRRVADEYAATPPNPAWAVCGVAPYVSTSPGYHWPRMLSMVVVPYLGLSGYSLGEWSGDGAEPSGGGDDEVPDAARRSPGAVAASVRPSRAPIVLEPLAFGLTLLAPSTNGGALHATCPASRCAPHPAPRHAPRADAARRHALRLPGRGDAASALPHTVRFHRRPARGFGGGARGRRGR